MGGGISKAQLDAVEAQRLEAQKQADGFKRAKEAAEAQLTAEKARHEANLAVAAKAKAEERSALEAKTKEAQLEHEKQQVG